VFGTANYLTKTGLSYQSTCGAGSEQRQYTFVLGQNKISNTFANFADLARFGMIVSVPLLFHHGVSVPDFKAMAEEFHVCQLCCLIWPLGQQILRTAAEL
jgi:hypothetical protein